MGDCLPNRLPTIYYFFWMEKLIDFTEMVCKNIPNREAQVQFVCFGLVLVFFCQVNGGSAGKIHVHSESQACQFAFGRW